MVIWGNFFQIIQRFPGRGKHKSPLLGVKVWICTLAGERDGVTPLGHFKVEHLYFIRMPGCRWPLHLNYNEKLVRTLSVPFGLSKHSLQSVVYPKLPVTQDVIR